MLAQASAGLLSLLVGGVLFAQIPGALAESRTYADTPVCRTADEARSGSSCVAKVPADVEHTERRTGGKSTQYWLHVRELGPDRTGSREDGRVRMRLRQNSPAYAAARTGDRVTLSYWKGEVRAVDFGTVTLETWSSPANDWRLPAGVGLLVTPFGLFMLWTSWWYRNRYPYQKSVSPGPAVLATVTLLGAGMLGLAGSMTTDTVQQTFALAGFAVPACAVLSLPIAWWKVRQARREASRRSVVPVRPSERRCVRAGVYGQVPYSVPGFDHLLLGEGPRPAVTADPAGRVSLWPLPETLTVWEVRAFRPGDPEHWPGIYQQNGVVIECRDGAQVVLIGSRRRDASLILGALMAPPVEDR
ncbi:hypothetical protein DSC45_06920 [Streptomyces sp. YIM 130001]|uniref:hypothetical protein n=1 Tax=Streptomyces sp. YIM 130001 TaxID=2259644 RepID=UPI000E657EC6|nr:hypothetical protein [Streptomyces sp. YIM 130001]RII19726.1 hypothetical protein DSC45_06920 [Streptomyces sp. YIM 130001]